MLALLLGGLIAGCGGNGGGDAAGKAADTKAPKKASSPGEAWAEKVNALHHAAYKETVAAMEGSNFVEALPKLRAIKEKYIGLLVPLGREREGMDAATKAQAENALLRLMMGFQTDETFKKYRELTAGPFSGFKARTDDEKEAASIVAAINIITQYAQFELLKAQLPSEAERLGIK